MLFMTTKKDNEIFINVKKNKSLQIMVEPDFFKEISTYANKKQVSVSGLLRAIIKKYFSDLKD